MSSASVDVKKEQGVKTKEIREFSTEFLRSKLKAFFKHKDFKSNLQKDAIKAVLKRMTCKKQKLFLIRSI